MLRREQEFTANASHELRTPLTAIRTSCELLLAKQTALPEPVRERIGSIRRAADDMTGHIQALLLLARGQSLKEREPVALRECVNDTAASMRADIARKGLAFEVDIAADTVIEANRQAVQLIVSNLIRNAVAYTEHGCVRVSYDAGRLVVSDSGVGIHAEQLARIVERNYRGKSGNDGGRVGIGLDIVKRICEQTGLLIDVASVPASGSLFTLRFSEQAGT
jgi:signal transduction histidine kinase